MVTFSAERRAELATNYQAVRERVDRTAVAAGRDPAEITILPVTKYHPVSDVAALWDIGVREVGENREQEARTKAGDFPEMGVSMIGQIQSKKANSVARWASSVHSVDSLKLIQGLERGMALALERGDRSTDILPCFIQISADGDIARGGAAVEDLPELVENLLNTKHLHFAGIMVVPPLNVDPTPVFEHGRKLLDDFSAQVGNNELKFSAGMSADMEKAISCGSHIVRVGTDILGVRQVG